MQEQGTYQPVRWSFAEGIWSRAKQRYRGSGWYFLVLTMKVRPSVKARCSECKIIVRGLVREIRCGKKRHNQKQGKRQRRFPG
jgi:ribosomal protein L36